MSKLRVVVKQNGKVIPRPKVNMNTDILNSAVDHLAKGPLNNKTSERLRKIIRGMFKSAKLEGSFESNFTHVPEKLTRYDKDDARNQSRPLWQDRWTPESIKFFDRMNNQ